MATTNALLHPLRIPRQVVVNQERTELQVYAFRRRFGGNHDLRILAEAVNQRGAFVGRNRTGDAPPVCRVGAPRLINGAGGGVIVRAVKQHHLAGVTVFLRKCRQMLLRAR